MDVVVLWLLLTHFHHLWALGGFYQLEIFCIALEWATSVCFKMSHGSLEGIGGLLCDQQRQIEMTAT